MTTPNPPVQTPSIESRSILIVDDEEIIRRVASLALMGAGYLVAEAIDTASAIEAVRSSSRPFDLVVLDLTLPDGDGKSVIPAIRQRATASRVLVVSGLGAIKASELGADVFLAKPFTKSSLLSAVQQALSSAGPNAK